MIPELFSNQQLMVDVWLNCYLPDGRIDPRRSAFFRARSILREVRDGHATC